MTIATEQLWDTFQQPLQQFIRRRVDNVHSAEDILQEVFLKIHTHIDTLQQRDRLASWIYQITRNTIIDHYRAQRPDVDLPIALVGQEDVAVDENVVQELLPCVAVLVDQLPEPYQSAVRLTEYEGLSQKALSEQLGISFSGAKSRVQRARAKIKQALLECCHFQFDHAGRIVDYQSRCASCAGGACGNSC